MCGIAGILSFEGGDQIKPQLIRGMCDVMEHRGPDEEGIFCQGPLGFGMRRLKIIDLETGQQPIFNEDGSVMVVFNGEIYNYLTLREDLIKKGHLFKTHSDTEVIVHLYEEMGEQFLDSLNGMFAIALWDRRRKKLILARDRFGEKPLHYFFLNNRVIFSSEIKSILSALNHQPEIEPEAVYHYFLSYYINAPLTIYKGIRKLRPGHYLRCTDKKIEEIKYWDFTYDPDYSKPESYFSEGLYELLRDSVRLRLVSDVPLGAFLSGGIDSSIIVGLMSSIMENPVKTYSIAFEDQNHDESYFAEQVAKYFGADHHTKMVKASAIDLLEKLNWHFDEPFGDSSAIPTFLLSKMTKENVTVALSGDGGDELFGGYERYQRILKRKKWQAIPTGLLKNLSELGNVLPNRSRGKSFLQSLALNNYHFFCLGLSPLRVGTLFSEGFRETVKHFNPYRFAENFQFDSNNKEYLSPFLYYDAKVYLPDDILVKVDRMSMAHSLETRVPFLDHRLVEFVAKIPGNLKIRSSLWKTVTKDILKRTFHHLLPKRILQRKKHGFTVPVGDWFCNELRERARDVLSPNNLKDIEFLNPKYIGNILEEHQKGLKNHKELLWACFVFVEWHNSWYKSGHTSNKLQCNRKVFRNFSRNNR